MMKTARRLRRGVRRAREILGALMRAGAACGTCGFAGAPLQRNVLGAELIAQWQLSPEWADWMSCREGSCCAWCGSSLRSAQLAAAIVRAVNVLSGSTATRLSALFRHAPARGLTIAEINSAGNLHRYLRRSPHLKYSEFGSGSANVPSEDLMKLSYGDASVDLVVTADTLEHVPDPDLALRETWRVLRPGGAHVFSIPVVWDRPTRRRAVLENAVLTHLLPPSHHGSPGSAQADFLVFHEFGSDVVERCRAAGFEVELMRDEHNRALVTFICRRPADDPIRAVASA